MPTYINVSGVWEEIESGTKVEVAGTWRTVETIEINVAGTWKTVFNNIVVSLSGIPDPVDDLGIFASAGAYLSLESDGDMITSFLNSGPSDVGDWVTPTSAAGAAFDCRMTVNSGDSLSQGTVGSWLSLGTTRTWGNEQFAAGSRSSNVTLEVRDAATLVVLSTATFVISCTYAE
jgi:hypothetical protein